jgi:metalloendopeptidase OMA1, mitochondrial
MAGRITHIATGVRQPLAERTFKPTDYSRIPAYHYPNDSLELERLDWQFICLKRLFNGKNYFAPWSQERPPKKILDLATGTGMWAIEMAEEFESSMVVGTDLSPIQPEFVPPNAHFYIHDA